MGIAFETNQTFSYNNIIPENNKIKETLRNWKIVIRYFWTDIECIEFFSGEEKQIQIFRYNRRKSIRESHCLPESVSLESSSLSLISSNLWPETSDANAIDN